MSSRPIVVQCVYCTECVFFSLYRYLSHNNISVVHDQDFKDLQGVTFIDLSHNGIEEIQGSPFSHLNTLEELHLHHNHLKDDDKNTERFHTSGMLIHIDLTANELNSIPDFNGKNFPHLQQLDFEQNNITFINETDLRNMTTLYVLILRENPIMEIHRKAFNECWHVTDLNLDYTRFKRLPDMKYMKRLTDLHIVHGQLEDFPEDFCDTSPNLLIIEATFNHVHRFNNFSGCHRLFSLALDHNDISEIPEGSLNGLTNLDVLKLHDNQINSIAPGVFDSLRILKALTLYHNNIRHLPKGIFSGLTALRKLYLAFNQISELPEYIFANNTLLTELVLNDNNIKEIHPTAFPEMPYLQLLNLSSNDFCSLEFPEVGFPSLRTLNLERLWCLHNVPTPHKMPNAQTIHYTYAYHCCLWEDTLNSDIYDENTTTPTTEPPEATQEVTLPPGIVTESDPFEDCQESDGEATDPNPDFSDFAEFYNITIEYGPGCDIKITLPEGVGTALSPEEIADLQNGGATTVLDETIVGTDSEEFFQGVDLFRHHYVPPPEYVPWEEVICYPKPNPLTPCDNLLDPWPIRVTIWTVWVLTLLGNISVLFILVAARQRMDVSQFFICVLAFSNTLLGIYLAFIAMVDIRTLGDRSFYQSALDWQKGSGCQTAGFLAIFSSQLSVYILIILTIERLHHVVRNITVPQPKESGKLRFAVLLIIIGIIYAALLAAFPLRGVGINAYDEVALCLPFVTTTTQDKNYILAVLSLNMLGILIVLIAFLTVFSCLFRPSLSQKKRWELFSSTIKLSLLMFTTFLCWFPIAFVGYSSILQEPIIDAIQAKYFIVFFFPLNALFSPIIYALITRSFRKNIWWIITCCPNVRNKEQSQSFRLIQRQTTSTPTSIMSSDLPRGQSPRSLTGEELRVLRQSRRSNSYSVQFNPSLQQCPTPPTPGTITRMGRRASLPAVFESNATERPSNLYEGTISTEQSPALPFRLAPGLLSQLNNSLPNLPEENELEEAQILESEVIVTTSTEEKVIRKLSTVPEGDEINTLSLELKPTNTPSSASQSARLEATNPEACMYDSVEYKLSGIAEHCMTSTLEPDLSINNSNKDNNIIIPDKDDLQLELKSSSILERNCSPPVKLDFEYERLRDPKVSGRLEIVNPRFAMLSPAEGSETEV